LIRRDAALRILPAFLAVALGVAACGDPAGPGPEPPPPPPPPVLVAVELPDSVWLDAIRDSVRLSAVAVYDDGAREPLEDGAWAGDGGDAATLHADGWVWTRGEGEFHATVSHTGFSASTRVVVRRTGRITLTFDDGWRSALTVAEPALSAAGLVANVAVILDALTWDAFLRLDEMRQLDEAGWAFVSHSVTHADLTTLSDAELEAELAEPRAWLLEQGLRTGDVFIVPLHSWGDRERAAVRRHYAAARGATVDYTWPEYVAEWRPADPYGITTLDASAMLRTAEGRAEIMDRVRAAIDGGYLLDLMFHDVPPEDVEAFQALVDGLAEVSHRVFTWAELYPVAAD
jgi:peptidoglycan/xylan/chitin deacetylase (PgdA/CDA1 family)